MSPKEDTFVDIGMKKFDAWLRNLRTNKFKKQYTDSLILFEDIAKMKGSLRVFYALGLLEGQVYKGLRFSELKMLLPDLAGATTVKAIKHLKSLNLLRMVSERGYIEYQLNENGFKFWDILDRYKFTDMLQEVKNKVEIKGSKRS